MAELEITLLKENPLEQEITLDNEPMSNDAYEDGYKLGYNDGYNKAESVNPLQYISIKGFQWNGITFPDNFDFVLKIVKKPDDCNAMLMRTTGIKTATLVCEAEGNTQYSQMIRESTVEILDLTNFKPTPSDLSYFAYQAKNLVSILGALDLSNCTKATSAFAVANALENIEFVPNTIPISISFSYSTKLTHDSLISIINGLATVTTTQTLTLGTTNLNKLTDTEKAIATQKNWNLA